MDGIERSDEERLARAYYSGEKSWYEALQTHPRLPVPTRLYLLPKIPQLSFSNILSFPPTTTRRTRHSRCPTLTLHFCLAYWIAFGPHGPRKGRPKGENWQIFRWTSAAVAISLVIFAIIRTFARPPPRTMNEQWQKMSNEYLKVRFFRRWLPKASLGLAA